MDSAGHSPPCAARADGSGSISPHPGGLAQQANLAAQFNPPSPGHPASIEVAGVRVTVWVDEEGLHMDPDLSGAEAWLQREDGTVPVHLAGNAFFAAPPPRPPVDADGHRATIHPIRRGSDVRHFGG
jgi:hypothetical protein